MGEKEEKQNKEKERMVKTKKGGNEKNIKSKAE